VNLVRDTTLNQSDFRVYNARDNGEITELYQV